MDKKCGINSKKMYACEQNINVKRTKKFIGADRNLEI